MSNSGDEYGTKWLWSEDGLGNSDLIIRALSLDYGRF